MVIFEVQDMSCGHCVSAITRAVAAVDAGARVECDLASRTVRVEPSQADRSAIEAAIAEAGYTPVAV